MLSFQVEEHGTASCEPGSNTRVPGRVAPGNGVLIIRGRSAWVARQDGTRAMVNARSVVFYEAGDWVEYGTSDWFKAEEYWAVSEAEGTAEAGLAAAGTVREWRTDEGFGVIDSEDPPEAAGRTSP